ncbi:L,D-transpeptidase [Gloeocapsopsis crepidinum LEGE 06123]|uniref:L,D-transpeptidase n=1 Tax=Gloeocapsopsis crepidinum LEGE 06123 TaxID=588587 RepID=A0ABR9UU10_9CHRO|nr:L,D-transpeptidase [Gloeocapsopsis crepidinum]MBE9190838.1 L,D-transpeptidase [Gloeocapsopsis crepidinum LEGE 06123]
MIKQLFALAGVVVAVNVVTHQLAYQQKLSEPHSVVTQSVTPQPPTSTTVNVVAAPVRLTIQLSSRKVTLYRGDTPIKSYPIAVGRSGWETPTGNFRVGQMLKNPTWISPLTDEVVPGGHPDNPLGSYWIGFWSDGRNSIGFHGTPNPESVGTAASHGCIRMYNKDVEELFSQVSLGTSVAVVE